MYPFQYYQLSPPPTRKKILLGKANTRERLFIEVAEAPPVKATTGEAVSITASLRERKTKRCVSDHLPLNKELSNVRSAEPTSTPRSTHARNAERKQRLTRPAYRRFPEPRESLPLRERPAGQVHPVSRASRASRALPALQVHLPFQKCLRFPNPSHFGNISSSFAVAAQQEPQ